MSQKAWHLGLIGHVGVLRFVTHSPSHLLHPCFDILTPEQLLWSCVAYHLEGLQHMQEHASCLLPHP